MSTSSAMEISARSHYVSTGHLPPPEQVTDLVTEAYRRFKSNTDGENSAVYPALARIPRDLFGICVAGTSGNLYSAGDADYEFSIMSVSKPFVFALVCQLIGPNEARDKLGVNSTGLPFNSLAAIEQGGDGRTNPMVNPGAIATTSLVPGATLDDKWQFIHDGLSRFAGRTLSLNEEVYASASETNFRNQSIARLLQSYGRIYVDPGQATDLYTKQCSLNVSARDLAVMGATLADGGVNPVTNWRRDRHRRPGQGRAWHVRAAIGLRGQQRRGPTGRKVPFRLVGNGLIRLATGDVRVRHHMLVASGRNR